MNAVTLSVISAFIILDKYAFGEFGISQPLITGLIFGAIFGKINEGIFVGGVFQMIFLGGLPIGRDIPPDGQGAGLAASGSYFLLNHMNGQETALLGALVLGFFASIVGGVMDQYARRLNEKLYHQFMRNQRNLVICHLSGMGTAFFRGLILFLPIFLLAQGIILPEMHIPVKILLLLTAVSLGTANGIYLFVKRNTILYFVMGIACALVLSVF